MVDECTLLTTARSSTAVRCAAAPRDRQRASIKASKHRLPETEARAAMKAIGLVTKRRLPNWPRRMKLHLAAAYVDESQAKFLKGVKARKWPEGTRDGGNVYWFIEDLDAALDKLKPADKTVGDGWSDYLRVRP